MLAIAAAVSLLIWIAILLLPWGPWRVREVLEKEVQLPPQADLPSDLSDITVVIPARDEAPVIAATLEALQPQGSGLKVVLVDDNSNDGTADAARQVVGIDLTVIDGEPLPESWAGKLWALDQGLRRVTTRYALLLDADIQLAPGAAAALHRLAQERQRPFVSIMAELPMRTAWEKLLTPSFIYFFKMLYPFALANGPSRRFASAAGGCILLETCLIEQIGGLQSIRSALIDDCTLASRLKSIGVRTWTGQSRLVRSGRGYRGLRPIWEMVARSAYVQLRYSPLLLLLTTLALLALFAVPPLGLLAASSTTRLLSLGAYLAMALTYLPTLRFYRLSPLWSLLLPLIGLLYLAMTWSSALRYYRGVRSVWKGRQYHA